MKKSSVCPLCGSELRRFAKICNNDGNLIDENNHLYHCKVCDEDFVYDENLKDFMPEEDYKELSGRLAALPNETWDEFYENSDFED